MASGQPSSSAGPTCFTHSDNSFPLLQHPNSHTHAINLNNLLPNNPIGLPNEISKHKDTTNYSSTVKPILIKSLSYIEGVPRVVWTVEEVDRMNIIENLQYAVIGKFSYGWPKIEEVRIHIPKQCNVKGECKIGSLWNRHILNAIQ
ncbi:hypothetical protein H5410_002016 [Solanum commersonii]|uniref:DUF4283 domain-containing protein n=1 Tax=Solanum commersonii TaxID=4109 RepID=A0A9J6B167_SOLCO|nr:hypothetical protein H5410_002016 [Solanum commersonii]